MKPTSLKTIAHAIHGELLGSDAIVQSISIDTRTLQKGDVFWAIKGETFDGQCFAVAAAEQGAAALVLESPLDIKIPQIIVKNTRVALGIFAKYYRAQFDLPVIAVTGSCGKTTTKELIAHLLSQHALTLFPDQSFNNDIGVPLTLFKLNTQHRYAVFELGANHLGEIKELTDIVQPTIAAVTLVAPVHLAGFGSIENIANEKGAIYGTLPLDGVAVINADDRFADHFRKMNKNHHIIEFSTEGRGTIQASHIKLDEKGAVHFQLTTPEGSAPIALQLLGAHNASNALCAVALATALKIPFETIVGGLKSFKAVDKRLNRWTGLHGSTIINDSYNANPVAVIAAIQVLANQKGRRILVLADMGELGDTAVEYHKLMGAEALKAGIEQLFTVGSLSQYASESFGREAQHFVDRQALIQMLKTKLGHDVTVLVKGSKSQRMWEIAEALRAA